MKVNDLISKLNFPSAKNIEDLNYKDLLKLSNLVIEDCIKTSRRFAGIPSPTSSHYYASTLFTTLTVRAKSFHRLIPKEYKLKNSSENWDHAGAAGILRSILEIRLCFFYLCVENIEKEHWETRWNILNLHDCTRRIQLFEATKNEDQVIGFKEQKEELEKRLLDNAYFKSLDSSKQKSLLNGRDAYLESLEEIAEKTGMEKAAFKWLYLMLSNHLHGLPFSFYRVGEENRGRGIYSEVEEGYLKLYMMMAIGLLGESREEMIQKFSDLKGD